MFNYDILYTRDFNIKEKTIDEIFKNISNIISKEQKWTLNIIFLDDSSIKNLNNKYRNINDSTDVLSFHYHESFSHLDKDDIAWEIIMSTEKIKKQWIEYWHWAEKEFYKLLIHSILHILWYDHESEEDYKIMQNYENQVWQTIFWKKQNLNKI